MKANIIRAFVVTFRSALAALCAGSGCVADPPLAVTPSTARTKYLRKDFLIRRPGSGGTDPGAGS